MTWMLKLYPPAWRRRYGEEFAELVGPQRRTLALIVDVAAGAVDAWLYPQESMVPPAAAGGKENVVTLEKTLRLSCAGYGPNLTARDAAKSAAAMIGSALVLATLWMWLRPRAPAVLDPLGPMAFFAAYFIGLRYTYLKDRSARTQFVLIGCAIALFTVFFLVIGRIAALL